jgi:hypothetical protein
VQRAQDCRLQRVPAPTSAGFGDSRWTHPRSARAPPRPWPGADQHAGPTALARGMNVSSEPFNPAGCPGPPTARAQLRANTTTACGASVHESPVCRTEAFASASPERAHALTCCARDARESVARAGAVGH